MEMTSELAANRASQPPETLCAAAIPERVSPDTTVYEPSAALAGAASVLAESVLLASVVSIDRLREACRSLFELSELLEVSALDEVSADELSLDDEPLDAWSLDEVSAATLRPDGPSPPPA